MSNETEKPPILCKNCFWFEEWQPGLGLCLHDPPIRAEQYSIPDNNGMTLNFQPSWIYPEVLPTRKCSLWEAADGRFRPMTVLEEASNG